jgi:hypothetical protein
LLQAFKSGLSKVDATPLGVTSSQQVSATTEANHEINVVLDKAEAVQEASGATSSGGATHDDSRKKKKKEGSVNLGATEENPVKKRKIELSEQLRYT